jgi:NAD(P)-dependent dehydrogenase (short-subunit alcohol dehydrogenase family)
VRHFFNECSEQIRPDILANNAGINSKGRTVDFSFKDFSDILSVNLSSTYRVTQACLPSMTEKRWGRIINITSVWSILGNANSSAYCALKFAVDGFTAFLAAEVAHYGILVNAIAPGYVLTEQVKRKYSDAEIKNAASFIPAGRLAEPFEIGELAAWLASEKNTYISGQNICVDGGLTWTAHPRSVDD